MLNFNLDKELMLSQLLDNMYYKKCVICYENSFAKVKWLLKDIFFDVIIFSLMYYFCEQNNNSFSPCQAAV